MPHKLFPCFWFDGKAKEAAEFYCSVFEDSSITEDTPMVVNFELAGEKFMALNGGPLFTINPSISFFVICETEEEIQSIWDKLGEGGKVMMALDKYPWSEKYGWVADRFGVSWQIMKGKLSDVGQKIAPSLMFTGPYSGKAEEAIRFYTSVFKPSSISGILHYAENEGDKTENVKHAQFSINNSVMMAMDSSHPHGFQFNEAISLVATCDTQEEIDYYWEKFRQGGEESMCGWIKDKFGVWWQVVPAILGQLMRDPQKAPKVVQAFMRMKKFDIKALEEAAQSA